MSQIYREAALLFKTVKRVLYVGYVLFRYGLGFITDLKVTFNFHLTFLE